MSKRLCGPAFVPVAGDARADTASAAAALLGRSWTGPTRRQKPPVHLADVGIAVGCKTKTSATHSLPANRLAEFRALGHFAVGDACGRMSIDRSVSGQGCRSSLKRSNAVAELAHLGLKHADSVDQVAHHHRKRVLIEITIRDPCFEVVEELTNIRSVTHFSGRPFGRVVASGRICAGGKRARLQLPGTHAWPSHAREQVRICDESVHFGLGG
jgi:hypothetical protein